MIPEPAGPPAPPPAGPGLPKVVVVGAGPAGVYAVQALTASGRVGGVDVVDAAPAPYGLVRYGVAPDHPRTRTVTRAFSRELERAGVRFVGNARLGRDLAVADLRDRYAAVVYATGMRADLRLGVPGEDLAGCVGAASLVSWYCGHPDAAPPPVPLERTPAVAVVGAGNVALDVARVLVRDPVQLEATPVPRSVLEVLSGSAVRDVHLLARRGPAHARFSTAELRELVHLEHLDVVVDAAELETADDAEAAELEARRDARHNLDLLREAADRGDTGTGRRVHLHFRRSPVAVTGAGRVEALVHDAAAGGDRRELPAGLVVRSIGYRGEALPGVPADPRTGVVPNASGRLLRDGAVSPGEYVTGWARRGPSGLIGSNRADAGEVVTALLDDLDALPAPPLATSDVVDLLTRGGGRPVDWAAWLRLEAHEHGLGLPHAGAPVVVGDLGAMLRVMLDG